jgi:hypothetical protein
VAARVQVGGEREQRTAVGEVSVYQYDRALLGTPWGAPWRAAQAEREEQRGAQERQELAPDDAYSALVGDRKVLERRARGFRLRSDYSHSITVSR